LIDCLEGGIAQLKIHGMDAATLPLHIAIPKSII
jgi:hypothetical protein